MLDFQLKQTPFRYGLAEGDDPHAVPFGVLTKLENYVWKKANRIEKRLGTEWLGSSKAAGGNISATARLFSRGKDLCLIDGDKLYSYSSATGTWTLVDRVPSAGLTWEPLVDTTDGICGSDTSVSGDYVVTAWTEGDPANSVPAGGELWIQVSRLSGEGMYLAPTSLGGTHQGVRVMIIGTTALFIVNVTSNATIYAYSLNLTTLAVTGPTAFITDRAAGSNQNWNVEAIDGTSDFVVAYAPAAGGLMRLSRFSSALAAGTTADVVLAAVVCRSIAVCATDGERVYVIFQNTNTADIMLYAANATSMVQVGATLVFAAGGYADECHVGVCRYDATHCIAVFSANDSAYGFITESKIVDDNAAIVANTGRQTLGTLICCQPFMLDGKAYVFASNFPWYQYETNEGFYGSQVALLELYDTSASAGAITLNQHRYVGNAETLLGAMVRIEAPLGRFHPSTSAATDIIGSLPFLGTAPSVRLYWRCGLRLLHVTAGASRPKDLWRSTLSGVESHFCCGTFSVYDGSMVFDYGFPYAPVFYAITTNAVGGHVLAGDYLYAAVLEFRGAADVLYRSGVGYHITALTTTGATSTNTVSVGNTNVGNKRHIYNEKYPTQVAMYRTVVNGTIPQRLLLEPTKNTLPNSYDQPVQTFTDTRQDSSIDGVSGITLAGRPAVYTASGEVNDQSPPAQVTMFTHVDRLWVLDGSQLAWWYSKRFGDNVGTAPGFNTAFRVVSSKRQIAGASMDDKAIFFNEEGIEYMLGQGPARDGSGNDFSTPTRIQTDVGCSNPRSVVSMPDGIMFECVRGIYLLSRGLELIWIGRPVQDTLALFPSITSATLVAHRNEIRFTANNSDETEGVVLVYNYIEKQWSTSRYYDGVSDTFGCPIADACMWNGAWTFSTPSGAVYKEVTGHHFDDTDTYATGVIETAWNSAAGPIAYHAVRNFWVQGVSNSDHNLTIEIAFDSNNTYQQLRLFPSGSRVTEVGDLEETKISVGKRRKCNSIRFKITDSKPTTFMAVPGSGAGPSFHTMGYEVGIKKGDNTAKGKKG